MAAQTVLWWALFAGGTHALPFLLLLGRSGWGWGG